MASSKPVPVHSTVSIPSSSAIAYTSADSKPSPLSGSPSKSPSVSATHGGNDGPPGATRSCPPFFRGEGAGVGAPGPVGAGRLPGGLAAVVTAARGQQPEGEQHARQRAVSVPHGRSSRSPGEISDPAPTQLRRR